MRSGCLPPANVPGYIHMNPLDSLTGTIILGVVLAIILALVF